MFFFNLQLNVFNISATFCLFVVDWLSANELVSINAYIFLLRERLHQKNFAQDSCHAYSKRSCGFSSERRTIIRFSRAEKLGQNAMVY